MEEPNTFVEEGLLEEYTSMAGDAEREREAEEWSEGLIGDVSKKECRVVDLLRFLP